jgi:hypothetical protein
MPAGPAVKRFFGADMRHIGIVVIFGEMRQHQKARVPVETFRIGQKFAHCMIGKMPGATHHALLDVPRLRPYFKHFEIVIGLQHQHVGIAQMMLHQFGHVT